LPALRLGVFGLALNSPLEKGYRLAFASPGQFLVFGFHCANARFQLGNAPIPLRTAGASSWVQIGLRSVHVHRA
jgi:hypothetical protein